MRIALLGTGEFGCPSIRNLIDAGHEIACAISQPDRPAGRGRRTRPSHVHQLADSLGIRHVQTADINALNPAEIAGDADLAFVAAFGQRIGPAWLHAFALGMINVHASLLPRYRGAAPFQWAVVNGERTTGVTIFGLNEAWDAGPILGALETEIGELETAAELHDRLAILGAELAVQTVSAIAEGRASPTQQDLSKATRAPKLSRADGFVDFALDAFVVQRRIHGLWSWPTATCELVREDHEPERVQLARATVVDHDAQPGTVEPGAFLADRAIQTGRGRIQLLEVKPAGGKLMPFDAYANGRQIAPPMRLRSGAQQP
jgi:methionyl-tRNA formyltransferase